MPNPTTQNQPVQDDASRLHALMGAAAPSQSPSPSPAAVVAQPAQSAPQSNDAVRLQALMQSDDTQQQSKQLSQPDHSILKDLTGASAEEWNKLGEDRLKAFEQHPIIQSLKGLGGLLAGGAKAVDQLNPVSIQKLQQEYEDNKQDYAAYAEARKQGKSRVAALEIAGQQRAKRNSPPSTRWFRVDGGFERES